jgi:putative endopeptidase
VTRHLLCILGLAASLAGLAHAADAPAAPPVLKSGIDLQYTDASVRAQDDFFQHQNGKWLAATAIPPDRPGWGTFIKLRDDVDAQLLALIEAAQKDPQRKQGSDAQKIGDFYTSFMDDKRRDELGYKPLAAELQRIRTVRDRRALPGLIAHLAQIGVAGPYAVSVGPDRHDSNSYAVTLSQNGLGMPDRDYYLAQNDAKLASVRQRYQAHIEKVLALGGAQQAAAGAQAVLMIETALAKAQWDKADLRDPLRQHQRVNIHSIATLAPGFDWYAALAAAGVAARTDTVILGQASYLAAFAELADKADLDAWKSYFEWQLLRSYSEFLSQDFVDARFAFYGSVLTDVPESRAKWKTGVAAVNHALGDLLGKQYVARYFPPERKARMEAMVANVLAAYRQSIDAQDWMSAATKQEAQAKLARIRTRIGYPDKWRDYGSLTVAPGELVSNVMRVHYFNRQRMLERLGTKVERDEWRMTPQTVNAAYNAALNEIVFPAAIMQPPFFDAQADEAVNYGAIGAVIGHEISHGFDDKGSRSDGDGNLRNWWTNEDRQRFNAKTAMLVAQYGAYSPLPGYVVNGKLTLGENIADNAGLSIAFKAYQLSLGGKPAPVIDGLNGAQRFFMGFAQLWRSKVREAEQIVQIKVNPHAPSQFRANGTLRNQDGFYQAFGVQPGDRMYLEPRERVSIW